MNSVGIDIHKRYSVLAAQECDRSLFLLVSQAAFEYSRFFWPTQSPHTPKPKPQKGAKCLKKKLNALTSAISPKR